MAYGADSAFVADGLVEPDADSLAVMSIAALEGAVVLCRSTRSIDPLRKVYEQLEFLVKAREFVRRNGLPERARPQTGSAARASRWPAAAWLP